MYFAAHTVQHLYLFFSNTENDERESITRLGGRDTLTRRHVCALDLCRAGGGKVARKGARAQLADGGPPTRDRSVKSAPGLESNTPRVI